MGYESRIYIVEKSTVYERDPQKRFATIVAMFDMCKYHRFSDFMRSKPATDCYIYADDGNTKIIEDEYGESLKEASVSDVITVLEKCVKDGEDYRRIFPLLAMLKSFEEHRKQWCDIVVLHFGH